jgi:hypothetical protein
MRGGVRGLSQWVQLCTWSPNKLWRSNSIFYLCLYVLQCHKTRPPRLSGKRLSTWHTRISIGPSSNPTQWSPARVGSGLGYYLCGTPGCNPVTCPPPSLPLFLLCMEVVFADLSPQVSREGGGVGGARGRVGFHNFLFHGGGGIGRIP